MDINKKLELIKRNTEEIIGEEELKSLLSRKKQPVVYWGTAPTGKPHVGYFLPMLKIADFLKAGFKVKILLADLHAALDNTPWPVLEQRYNYYAKVIPLIIESVGVKPKDLQFIKGSDFQLKPEYMFDVLQMSSIVSVHDSEKAASEVVKITENPKLSGLIYPIMQALDEQYLSVDAQLGGTDQRKIMVLARENLPKLNYKQRIEILNPLVPGLVGKKMSASDEKSKIDLLDDEQEVIKKINNADCILGDPNNGINAIAKYLIFVIKHDEGKSWGRRRCLLGSSRWGVAS
jgi:tyrosyl-tRNA synthetase